MKAGMLKTGDFASESVLRSGVAKLIVLAENASGNTKKKFINKAFYYKIPVYIYGCIDDLSHSTGVVNRAVFAVTDSGFAANIVKQLRDANITEAGEWRKCECMK
jgi:ribosomal protein L7Ae-like RNA K-turn-binding protein